MLPQNAETGPELVNIATLAAAKFHGTAAAEFLRTWENVIFSLIIVFILSLLGYMASRNIALIPVKRLQSAFEIIVGLIDDFVCGVIGPKGKRYTPFVGTLFIYIFAMNLAGLIPFMKAPTASWSTTLALAICVFIYVQYTGIKELGFVGYIDHLLGRPRGVLAFSLFIPLMMLILHVVSELVRPISLSLRLRSNIWGDDMLLAVFAGFGIKGVPLLIFNSFLAIIVALVQTVVFCLLTTIYFTLAMTHEE
jgi:F-type H+-transporting ATPase subunit a